MTKRSVVPAGTTRKGFRVPFEHLLAHRASGTLDLSVLDARSGRAVRGARFRWEQPGAAPVRGEFDRSVKIAVKTGMPGNLYVDAPGYDTCELRQIELVDVRRDRKLVARLEPNPER